MNLDTLRLLGNQLDMRKEVITSPSRISKQQLIPLPVDLLVLPSEYPFLVNIRKNTKDFFNDMQNLEYIIHSNAESFKTIWNDLQVNMNNYDKPTTAQSLMYFMESSKDYGNIIKLVINLQKIAPESFQWNKNSVGEKIILK